MTTMRAIIFERYGKPDVLEETTQDIPDIKDNDVLVKVVAAGINPADTAIRSGKFKLILRTPLPFVPGSDVAGVVTDVGENVQHLKPGDSVYAMKTMKQGGAYAEYTSVEATQVARMPVNLTYCEASAVPLAALTAWQALQHHAHLKPGQSILINGASGGVGTFAVQIAKALGATVTAVCSARNVDLVKSLGADSIIDYNEQPLSTITEQYDVVFDVYAYLSFRTAIQRTKRGGTFVSLNPGVGNPITKLIGRIVGRNVKSFLVKSDADDLMRLSKQIEEGNVKPVVAHSYSLQEVTQAHHESENGHPQGKLVFVIDESLANTYPV